MKTKKRMIAGTVSFGRTGRLAAYWVPITAIILQKM